MGIEAVTTTEPVAADLINTISRALSSDQKVVWLVCGGSNIHLATEVANRLEPNKNLHILLTDERYGPVGHADSNWQQLLDIGFPFARFTSQPMLVDNSDAETTAARYSREMQQAIEGADAVVALFGMGADGHVAGILPGTPPLTSTDWVSGYQADPFYRITITPLVFPKISVAILCTSGDEKLPQLKKFETETPIAEQPVQLLKQTGDYRVYHKG